MLKRQFWFRQYCLRSAHVSILTTIITYDRLQKLSNDFNKSSDALKAWALNEEEELGVSSISISIGSFFLIDIRTSSAPLLNCSDSSLSHCISIHLISMLCESI